MSLITAASKTLFIMKLIALPKPSKIFIADH
jgi:hypothetical protein